MTTPDPVLTHDEELRVIALNIATRDRFHFSGSGEPNHVHALEDAKAYYTWLTESAHS